MIQNFKDDEYEILIENTIKQFVMKNQDEFDGLFTEEIFTFDMATYYDLVIQIYEILKCKPKTKAFKEMDKQINPVLEEMLNQYKNIPQKGEYQYVYVVQKYDGMVCLVGKSHFKTIDSKSNIIDNEKQGDLFEDISYFKYDIKDDDNEDKINLSLISSGKTKPKITGTQAIETIKYCIKKTENQSDINVLNEYFKKNKEEIRQKLRRLYKKAWIIPIKGGEKNAEDFETALGNYLEEQKDIFISNKDSHKY
ncbi:hypothetical protein J9174_02505 [Macrococcoides canis]|uniref:hypothetical protein n=1 Tax=Macrococcoides canis TaxID=1855823 RepID=UPI001AEBD9C0|nr:hypothetical protein [Macrococcus canis]QTQ08568.1 hypothetical protein J9174_02505 [Macrococcus canis]